MVLSLNGFKHPEQKRCIIFVSEVARWRAVRFVSKTKHDSTMDKYNLHRLAIIVLLIVPGFVHSNTQNSFFEKAGLSMHGGRVVPHDKAIDPLAKGAFLMKHLSFSGQVKGDHEWHALYNYPELGLNFLYTDLGYPEVLGKAFAFFPHIAFNLFSAPNFSMGHNQGIGIAYLTRPFHESTNPENAAIGSAVNIVYNMTLEARWVFTPNWTVYSGLSLTHFSNGRIRTPNKGLNIPAVKLGLGWNFSDNPVARPAPVKRRYSMRPEWITLTSGGLSSTYPPGSPVSRRFSVQSTFHYPLSQKTGAGLGYDFFYSERKQSAGQDQTHSIWYNLHGLHLAWQQSFSKLSFIFHKGIYFHDKSNFNESLFYHRVGFRFNPFGGIVFSLSLKTHFFQAENLEWGIGYKF